jgi:hypothetical protein
MPARQVATRAEGAEPPVRFRALSFGRPLGPWRARRVLAQQDAIDAGQGSREWESGLPFMGPGVSIISEPGEVPIKPADQRLAQALAFHRKHGAGALTRAATKQAAAEDPSVAQLWGEILEELRTIRAEALRAERVRC